MVIWLYIVPALILGLALYTYFTRSSSKFIRFCLIGLSPFYLMTVGFVNGFNQDNVFAGAPYFLMAAAIYLMFLKRTSGSTNTEASNE